MCSLRNDMRNNLTLLFSKMVKTVLLDPLKHLNPIRRLCWKQCQHSTHQLFTKHTSGEQT